VTGLDGRRVYLDWNATAPLRPEARAAMLAAMDVVGNPSSVHAEGRAARKIVETARRQVAALVNADPSEVIFTSGATEANNAVARSTSCAAVATTDHDSMTAAIGWHTVDNGLAVTRGGVVDRAALVGLMQDPGEAPNLVAVAAANAETGVREETASLFEHIREVRAPTGMGGVRFHSDATQAAPRGLFDFTHAGADSAAISAHKMGGPKGVGALLLDPGVKPIVIFEGGGQEFGYRSGTENVVGIAGFGAAAEAAQRDLEAGVWDRVEKLRNVLEDALATAAPKTIFFGQESPRLANTTCFAVPGWKGETQVMQMDLAGFAISAGSACSSGKVSKASRVLLAMGHDEETASSAIRVSLGPTTTEAEVTAFADAWLAAYRRHEVRAA